MCKTPSREEKARSLFKKELPPEYVEEAVKRFRDDYNPRKNSEPPLVVVAAVISQLKFEIKQLEQYSG